MKTFRFVTTRHHDVHAESVEDAIKAFKEMKEKGILSELDKVNRIEVQDEEGNYIPVDRPLRAGDLDSPRQEWMH